MSNIDGDFIVTRELFTKKMNELISVAKQINAKLDKPESTINIETICNDMSIEEFTEGILKWQRKQQEENSTGKKEI